MQSPDLTRWIGKPLAEVDTPSLLLDAPALHANLARLAGYFAGRHCRLRPHFKSHKCTRIARLQMEAGAVGITCAKLGEAEVLADAGIRDILIANEIVGPAKLERLIALTRRAQPIVAVDSVEQVKRLSAAAAAAGQQLRVLVEVDIGMHRCGVAPGQAALDLARVVASSPGLVFTGLQGYEGHCVDLRDAAERTEQTLAALQQMVSTRRLIEQAGVPVAIVSGGGTGTYDVTGNCDGVDELQAGSYAAMDWFYQDIRPEFLQAQTILTTLVSRPEPTRAILDVGRKGFGAEWGPPRIKDLPGAEVAKYSSEEHLTISLPADAPLQIGDHVQIVPSHGCTTSNLYREYVVHQNGVVVDLWPIEGSGQLR